MKKALVVIISALLVLSFAIGASAATNTEVFVDLIPNGSYTFSLLGASPKAPLSGVLIGTETVFGNVKVGVECLSASSPEAIDYYYGVILPATNNIIFNIKGGYRVVENKQLTLDLVGSCHNAIILYPDSDFNVIGFLIGGDLALNVHRDVIITGSYQFSLSAAAKSDETIYPGTVNISYLSLKAHYLVTPNLRMTGGYRSNSYTSSYSGLSVKESFGGMTLGLIFML